jgi:PKD repeat protein
MEKKKLFVQFILAILFFNLSIINTVSADSNDWMVYGYVYLNNKIVLPNEVILTISTQDYENILFLSGKYAIYFREGSVGTIGTFKVIIDDEEYTPKEKLIIEEEVSLYNIDLYVSSTGEKEPEDPTNIQPKADAGGPYYGIVNFEINFDGANSFDSDGTISKYVWDLGDGTTKTGFTQTHTYYEVNKYRVTLTVTDNKGKTDLDITYAYITDTPNNPPSQPLLNGMIRGTTNTLYNYTLFSTDFENDTIRYLIDWGDDADTILSNPMKNGTIYTVDHAWVYPGIYSITAYAIDEKDVLSQESHQIVMIDTIYCDVIGFMTDYTNDSIYDLFYSNRTGEETPVKKVDSNYLIDEDNDGDYDCQFNMITMQVSKYVEPVTNKETSSLVDLIEPFIDYILIFIIIFLFLTIGVLVYKIRKKSKKQRGKKIKNKEKKKKELKKEKKIKEKEQKKKIETKKESAKPKEKVKRVEDEIDKLLEKKKK